MILGRTPKERRHKITMLYNLNINYTKSGNGRDSAIKNRMQLLQKKGIASKVVTIKYNTHRYHERIHGVKACEYENMYEYFQNARNVIRMPTKIQDIFPSDVYTSIQIPNSNDFKIYKENVYVAVLHCFECEESVSYVNYFDKSGRKIKRCFYDYRGFLSSERFLGDNQLTLLEVYYTPSGEKALEKYYTPKSQESSLTMIKVKYRLDGSWICLYTEDELINLYLENLLDVNDTIIVDRNIAYAKAVLSLKKKVKIISVIHSTHFVTKDPSKGRIKVHYVDMLNNLNKIEAIITSTEHQRREIIERFNNENKIRCIPVGYRNEVKQISPSNSAKIISVARLAPEKRVEHTILAFVEIIKHIPEARLHLYGAGPEEINLRKLVKANNLDDAVVFHGYLADLSEEYSTSKLILLSSVEEGFSLALMEAASYGIPAVSYNVRYGPSDLIDDGETGFLTEEDPHLLAEKAITLLSNPDMYRSFSDNTYAKSFDFNEEMVYERWKKLL